MRMMTWAWPVSVALAVGAGFVGGSNWERRHRGPGPRGPRDSRLQAMLPGDFGPPEFHPGGPPPFPPPFPPPHDRGFDRGPPPGRGPHDHELHDHGPPGRHRRPEHSDQPERFNPRPKLNSPSDNPPSKVAPPETPKLSAAAEARLEDLRAMREIVGSPLRKGAAGEEENLEAKLLFEEALRTVIAEEMAKPTDSPKVETPVPVTDEVPAPSALPAAELPGATIPPTTSADLPPDLSLPVAPTSAEDAPPALLPAPHIPSASGSELRFAARLLEQRAAEAEEAGLSERADKLRQLAATLWQESRSTSK